MAKQAKKDVYGEKVTSPKGRVSFPHVYEKNTSGKYPSDKYELTLLFPKNTDMSLLEQALMKVAKEAHGSKIKSLADLVHNPIRDGDEKDNLGGYAGHWYIKAKSSLKPGIIGPDKQPLHDPEQFYPGCWARMSLVPGSYEQGGKPGVTFYLQNIQWLGHGERFGGGGGNPQNDFDEVEELGQDSGDYL